MILFVNPGTFIRDVRFDASAMSGFFIYFHPRCPVLLVDNFSKNDKHPRCPVSDGLHFAYRKSSKNLNKHC